MTEAYWGTTNIKVASAVASFGAKPRQLDPVTRTIKENGEVQATFWFEAGAGAEAKAEMERPWSEMKSDPEGAGKLFSSQKTQPRSNEGQS